MPRKAIDITGNKYGKLSVISRDLNRESNRAYWFCKCECGNEISTTSQRLRRGTSKSCGCSRNEYIGKANTKHGMTGTRIYKIWCHMNERCKAKTHKQYSDYGGRGIKVCDEWSDFSTFFNWAKNNGYKEELTLDRIDNNGGYFPSNCRWADVFTQQNNQRRTVRISVGDVTKTLSEWSNETGIKKATIYSRLRYGKTGYQLISSVKPRLLQT